MSVARLSTHLVSLIGALVLSGALLSAMLI